ncbi:MAG: hypothetical protein AABX71_01285, partial [Nanoarchaeota archaeon]
LSMEDKNFRLVLKGKKFSIIEIKHEEADRKIAKIINKKVLKKNKVQINLSDGRNYMVDKNMRVGDSVIINLRENKIAEILPLKTGCRVIFTRGKHVGEEGTVEDIDEERKSINLKVGREKLNSKPDILMVIK